MKIAIDARMYGTENGGIGRYVINLIDQLQKLDTENNYSVLLRKHHFNKLSLAGNWEKILVDARHYSFKEQFAVARSLNAISPDLVHFPHFNVPVNYHGRYIVTIHDLLMHKRGAAATTLHPLVYFVKRVGYRLVFENSIKRAHKIIVPTKFVKQEVAKTYPQLAHKLEVIYEGVDESVFSGLLTSGYLRRNNIVKPYFLYAGNVYPHKNIARLIEATVAARAKLVIVTPRNVFQKRLEEFIKNHNAKEHVYFTGYVEDRDLSTLYKNATAFVYPSLEEGFGLPGLEAMANKCLVLASDISVFKEVYKDNAIYFNPMDFSSILREMSEVLKMKNDQKEKLTAKAHEFAKNYSWEKTARETLKIYETAVS